MPRKIDAPLDGVWMEVHEDLFTPGGEQLYDCPVCCDRAARHLHGVENPAKLRACPVCGARLVYPMGTDVNDGLLDARGHAVRSGRTFLLDGWPTDPVQVHRGRLVSVWRVGGFVRVGVRPHTNALAHRLVPSVAEPPPDTRLGLALGRLLTRTPRPVGRAVRGGVYMWPDFMSVHLCMGPAQALGEDWPVRSGCLWLDLGVCAGLDESLSAEFADLDAPAPDVMHIGVRWASPDTPGLRCFGRLLPEGWFAAHALLADGSGVVNLGPPMDEATLKAAWALLGCEGCT